MRLRLPSIGHGFGPGGDFGLWLWENIIFDRKARVARHARVKTTKEEEASIDVGCGVMVRI